MKPKVGRILSFDYNELVGKVLVDGKFLHFSMKGSKYLVPGVEEPEIAGSHYNKFLHPDTEISIFEIRGPWAWSWAGKCYYDKAVATIEARPTYRVLSYANLFNGEFVHPTNNVVEIGSREKLSDKFPRILGNDPLGTMNPYVSGPSSRRNRWEKLIVNPDGSSHWERVDDPRPMPEGILYRVLKVSGDGREVEIYRGTAYMCAFKFPVGGKDGKDPLKGAVFQEYRYCGIEMNHVWVEVGDFRVPSKSVKAPVVHTIIHPTRCVV